MITGVVVVNLCMEGEEDGVFIGLVDCTFSTAVVGSSDLTTYSSERFLVREGGSAAG